MLRIYVHTIRVWDLPDLYNQFCTGCKDRANKSNIQIVVYFKPKVTLLVSYMFRVIMVVYDKLAI